MFLNENVNPAVDVLAEEVSVDYAFGEAGVMALNYDLSEDYHGLVESMICAEHEAIVNEDANLLDEAGNAFFQKVGEIFTKMKNGLISIWNKVQKFFSDRVKAIQKKIATWKVGKVSDLSGRTVVTGDTVEFRGSDLGKDCLAYAKNATNVAKRIAKETGNGNENPDDVFKLALGVDKGVAKNSEKFRAHLTKTWVKDTKKEVTYKVDGKMCKFVITYADVISGIKEAFETAIKAYDELAKFFDGLKVEVGPMKGDNAKNIKIANKANSNAASICRSVAASLNVALGVATTLVKEQQSIAWRCISKAKAQVKDGTPKKSDVKNESTILDRFAL